MKLLLRTTRRVTRPTPAGRFSNGRGKSSAISTTPKMPRAEQTACAAHCGWRCRGIRNSRSHSPPAWLHGAASETAHRASDVRPTEDLIAEGADMALRLGALPDFGFGARLLGKAPRLAVASPGYIARKGTPQTPADLAMHDCILGPGLSGRTGWSFTRSGEATSVTVEGSIKVASADGVVACAKAGLGIALASRWMCRAEVEAGKLVAIFPIINLMGSSCTLFTRAAGAPLSRHEPFPIILRLSSCTKMKAAEASTGSRSCLVFKRWRRG